MTGETLTATTNLLTFFKIIICQPVVQPSSFLPFANCGTMWRYKTDNKRLSREKFDPWSFMNVLTSGANFLAFRLENIDILIIPRNSHFLGCCRVDNFYNYLIDTIYKIKSLSSCIVCLCIFKKCVLKKFFQPIFQKCWNVWAPNVNK